MANNEIHTNYLESIEQRIALHMRSVYKNLLWIGKCLVEAKDAELVPHGEWESWVRTNTGMSERSAQRLMQAARVTPDDSAMATLSVSKIQALIALPEEEREPMAERAIRENMTLRELRDEVHRQTQLAAEADARAQQEAARHEDELRALRSKLEQAQRAGTAAAQSEIERLRHDLADAEAYAEKQAQLRQQAQQELLNHATASVRQRPSGGDGILRPDELASAAQTFIGTVGVMPHMGVNLAGYSESDRQRMRRCVDMIAAWADGARKALDTIVIDGQGN